MTLLPPGNISELIGFRLVEQGEGLIRLEFDAGPQHANPMGTVQGGALAAVADAAMGMAFRTLLGAGETFTTLELKINFVKAVRSGKLRAEGRVLKAGRTIGLAQCEIVDEAGALVSHSTSTLLRMKAAAEGFKDPG